MDRTLNRRIFVVGAVLAMATAPEVEAQQASPEASPAIGDGAFMKNKSLVTTVVDALFNQRDLSAIDRYFAPDFLHHSSLASGGLDDLRAFVSGLDSAACYELVRVFADGDRVAMHGRYTGVRERPLIAFDVYRVSGDRIVEQWTGIQAEAGPNPSGHTMLDGPTEVSAPEQTEDTRSFLTLFVDQILLGQQPDRFADFIGAYIQHNPLIADGLEGLGAARASISAEYRQLHLTVIEGEFGLLVLDGLYNGEPSIYYDLFRVENGKIQEHWDVIEATPWQ